MTKTLDPSFSCSDWNVSTDDAPETRRSGRVRTPAEPRRHDPLHVADTLPEERPAAYEVDWLE